MGKIAIKIEDADGGITGREFDSDQGGHAYALTRAIGFLFARMSPAIRDDHANHELGIHPETPFGRKE